MYDQPSGQPAPHSPSIVAPPRPEFYIALTSPTVSRVMIGLNLLTFAATFVFGLVVFGTWTGPVDIRVLYLLGMKSNIDILNGEIWRLFTAMFLHIGPTHLISNLIGLFMLGPILEGHLGHWRFIAIYLVGGLFGSVASYALSPALSAGASGAIFALLGATVLYFFRFRENFGQKGQEILRSMLVVLVLNLVLGSTVANVDNWGHVGGLLGGLLVCAGLFPRYRLPDVIRLGRQPLVRESNLARQIGWVLLSILLLVLAFWLATQAGPPLR
ncbi:MAG: rhomboid family intramembrane serine protease [Chloroflexi bacterium]|nr:rhomboid family intramembrane serine protease [Chloroflexota bacterium]